jgi:hypothetical protein
MDSCEKHPHESGVALCRRCGHSWCGPCLVYSFGPKKPPYCMSCAMVAGGVRTTSSRPAMPRKELKARMRSHKAEVKSAAKSKTAEPTEDVDAEAAMSETDWATPWWEDRQSALAD